MVTVIQRPNYNYLALFLTTLYLGRNLSCFSPSNQSCGVPWSGSLSWPNKMIDFPQFGSSRNFIKPGHWLWVNQRQDDDDLLWSPELSSSPGSHQRLGGTKRIKHFNQRQLPTFDRRTRLLVILEHWSHSILSIEQNIKSMHEIKCSPPAARRIVVINSKVDLAWHCWVDQGSRGRSNSRLLPSSIRH